MKASLLDMKGLVLIQLAVHKDARGSFSERYHALKFQELELGLPIKFVQENHARSRPGVLRGLHFQYAPAQGKLVGVLRGRIWDVVVDLRSDSTTFGEHSARELSDADGQLLWIPAGFAHGYCVLGDEPADVVYSVDAFYHPDGEGGIVWNDPDLGIAWPLPNPIISKRDQWLSRFAHYRSMPITWQGAAMVRA